MFIKQRRFEITEQDNVPFYIGLLFELSIIYVLELVSNQTLLLKNKSFILKYNHIKSNPT